MKIGETRDPCDSLVQPRVVLHRAGAERIHAEIDRVVPGRHTNEVTYHVDLAHFGHAFEIVVTTKLGGNVQRDFVDVERRQAIADAPRLRALEDELLVLADVTSNFCNRCSHKNNRSLTGPINFLNPQPARQSVCGYLSPSRKRENRSDGLT